MEEITLMHRRQLKWPNGMAVVVHEFRVDTMFLRHAFQRRPVFVAVTKSQTARVFRKYLFWSLFESTVITARKEASVTGSWGCWPHCLWGGSSCSHCLQWGNSWSHCLVKEQLFTLPAVKERWSHCLVREQLVTLPAVRKQLVTLPAVKQQGEEWML